jgi:hypothetical protein
MRPEALLDNVHTRVLVVMGTKDPDFADQQGEASGSPNG